MFSEEEETVIRLTLAKLFLEPNLALDYHAKNSEPVLRATPYVELKMSDVTESPAMKLWREKESEEKL